MLGYAPTGTRSRSRAQVMLLSTVLATAVLAGCAANDPYQRTKVGAGIGAAAGGVLGAIVGDTKGAVIGAAAGALTGGLVGNYMDDQQREFEQALAAEQRSNALEIQRLKDDTLKLSVNNEVTFDVNRAEIKPAFYDTLEKLAAVLSKYNRTVVHVVGHTDSDGSAQYNLDLSRRRAEAVAGFLVRSGVDSGRVREEGRGESEPRSSNSSAAGKQLNRRVELFVKPIVEGNERRAYDPPPRLG